MKLPLIRGLIDRRILANYRVDADVLARVLPAPFRPKLIGGFGVAGICLIRLKQIRPRGFPQFMGISSENAAHRIAVEWEDGGAVREGVFIPRRDSSSRLNVLAGGRVFTGVHHHAHFAVEETSDHFSIEIDSDDRRTHVRVDAKVAEALPAGSVFGDVARASDFFRGGSLGYSPSAEAGRLDALELHSLDWKVEPMAVERIESSFFDDRQRFPAGSIQFDCALLMRGMRHEWHEREPMCVDCAAAVAV
ncbi:MAG: hypothetical protein JWN40_993 [Phycisphaerales bacterium]|nr:hypothetical protein [Phycisphaerales bacterium]